MKTVENVEIRSRKGKAIYLEKGRMDAVLRDFKMKDGSSDPVVDFGDGFFVHVSTIKGLDRDVFVKGSDVSLTS